MFCIGRVLRATGLAGEVRLQLFRPRRRPDESFASGSLELGSESGDRSRHRIKRARWIDPTTVVVALEGVSDRNQAEAMIGSLLWIDPKAPPPYITDRADRLLGALAVDDTTGNAIGEVTGVQDNGAQAMLAVDVAGTERLVPFVEAFVAGTEERDGSTHVRIRAIPGLFDEGEGD